VHTVSTILITSLDSGAGLATSIGTWIAGYPIGGDCRLGRYDDEMRREPDGVWRFTVRRLNNVSAPRTTT
jgi:hypothetical protein